MKHFVVELPLKNCRSISEKTKKVGVYIPIVCEILMHYFDEIFFVDLPDLSIRAEILAIHMQKRKLVPKDFNLHLLATLSEGFSGAEIEQALVGALYSSLGTGQDMSTALIAEQLKNTKPLSVLMAERIESLREWASTRTTPA